MTKMFIRGVLKGLLICIIIVILAAIFGPKSHGASKQNYVIASFYGDAKDIRRTGETRVATGARLDANGMTVAHKTLPFGTKLTLYHSHRSAVVTVNDRGPYVWGRTYDLTPAVKKALRCGDLCRVRAESWPPLPKPRPEMPDEIASQ